MIKSDQNAVTSEAATLVELRKLAREMGITFHPSIGVAKLEARIKAKRIELDNDIAEPLAQVPIAAEAPQLTVLQQAKLIEDAERRELNRIRKEASRLVRVVVTCKNPAKQEWPGEIFTVGSRMMGSHKKFVPFDNAEGWHIPQAILTMIDERMCQIHINGIDEKGRKVKKSKLIKEFGIEILDPLTSQEMKDLATRQAMANNID